MTGKAKEWWNDKPPPRPGVQRGEDMPAAKLTEEIVRQCRLAHARGWSHAELARRYKVSVVTMWGAVTRRTWKHVA